MKKHKIYLSAAIALFGVFFLFTALVINLDLDAIGPYGSIVGLSKMNGAFADLTGGYNELWYDISEIAGLIPLATAGCFAILGLYQAIKRKNPLKVDPEILVLGVFYVLVLQAYLTFEVIVINYRPVLIDGVLEASYPSSHTMLSLCIMTTAIFEINRLLKGKKAIVIVADILCGAIALTVLIGRLLSGVHWLSDIIAGILLSAALICLYRFAVLMVQKMIASQKSNTVNDSNEASETDAIDETTEQENA